MNDIPLEHAQILWSDGPDAFAVVVDYRAPADRFRHLDNSRGAGGDGWSQLTTAERLALLMSVVWSAIIRDAAPADAMHRALVQIPEYRAWVDFDVPGVVGSENA
ncbi:hypothetical protein [Sphingomonas sp. UYP23]